MLHRPTGRILAILVFRLRTSIKRCHRRHCEAVVLCDISPPTRLPIQMVLEIRLQLKNRRVRVIFPKS